MQTVVLKNLTVISNPTLCVCVFGGGGGGSGGGYMYFKMSAALFTQQAKH